MESRVDGIRFAKFVVGGYTLRPELTERDKENIRQYVETGNPELLPYHFRRLRDRLRQSPDDFRRLHK